MVAFDLCLNHSVSVSVYVSEKRNQDNQSKTSSFLLFSFPAKLIIHYGFTTFQIIHGHSKISFWWLHAYKRLYLYIIDMHHGLMTCGIRLTMLLGSAPAPIFVLEAKKVGSGRAVHNIMEKRRRAIVNRAEKFAIFVMFQGRDLQKQSWLFWLLWNSIFVATCWKSIFRFCNLNSL